jgi:hypothetical protein
MEERPIGKIDIPDQILHKWQSIVDILANLIGVPAALIMRIVDQDIEVFVSSESTDNPYNSGDKEHLIGSGLYCETVIKTKDMLLVPDALSDEKWKDNPDIKLKMISYLGFPLVFPDGKPFGTICVLDNKVNYYTQTYIELIQHFRDLIQNQIELLYMNNVLGEKYKQLSDSISEIHTLRGILPICMHCKRIRDDAGFWQAVESYIRKHTQADFSHSICPDCLKEYYPEHNKALLKGT